MVVQRGQGEKKPEAYFFLYVEAFFEPRTKPDAIFSIPLKHGIY